LSNFSLLAESLSLTKQVRAEARISALAELAKTRATAEGQLHIAHTQLERRRRAAAIEQERFGYARSRRDHLREERERAPAQFSALRGTLFLFLAFCALIGDITFLAVVLGRLLGLDIRDPVTHLTFSNMIFRAPLEALQRFADIALLSVAVLTLAFVLKLWSDSKGLDRFWRLCLAATLVISFATLAVVSAVRWHMPIEAFDYPLTRIATILLGLALPMSGCMFFVDGLDRIAKASRLAVATLTAFICERRVRRTEPTLEERSALTAAEAELKWVCSDEFFEALCDKHEAVNRRAFADAVEATSRPGGLYSFAKQVITSDVRGQ
jgi:hypothetical protein